MGLALNAQGVVTFQADWNNGNDFQPDLAGQTPAFTNNDSFWQSDIGNLGHMNLRGNPDATFIIKPWWNRERMREDLSPAGGSFEFWFKPEETQGPFKGHPMRLE